MKKAAILVLLLVGAAYATDRVRAFYRVVHVNQSVIGISCPGNGGDPHRYRQCQRHTVSELWNGEAMTLDAMIDWENGELDEQGTVELFQDLVNSGLAWKLQGMYGRQAKRLIDAGLVQLPKQ